jgi:CheY-like chemotaxis protein
VVSRLRVLVVEDEALVALGLENMLINLGHDLVAMVAGLSKALVVARVEALDLGILDVNIRGQESYAVADVLAARGIPVIFATGYEPARLRQPYRDGLVLQKPFQEADLAEMIAAAVR